MCYQPQQELQNNNNQQQQQESLPSAEGMGHGVTFERFVIFRELVTFKT